MAVILDLFATQDISAAWQMHLVPVGFNSYYLIPILTFVFKPFGGVWGNDSVAKVPATFLS